MTLRRRDVLAAAGAGGTLAFVTAPLTGVDTTATAHASPGGPVDDVKRLADLAAATAVTDDDVFVGGDGSTTKKFPATVLRRYATYLPLVVGNDEANPYYPLHASLDYQRTDIARAGMIGLVGVRQSVNVGSQASAIAATGSVLGLETSVLVRNTAQATAEHAATYAVLRYDQDGVNGGTPGRGWLGDWSVHGAIGMQQQILTGLNVVVGNYYNGQPSENPSVGIALQAGNSIGGSLDPAHAAATRYPNGVGLAILGSVTGGTGRGWNTGIQIGGSGGGWNISSSKVGYGIDARDHDTAAIRIHDRSGTAAGIIIEASGGPLVVGTTAEISSVASFVGTFEAPAGDPASSMNTFLTSDAQAAGRGASIGLGGMTTDAAGTPRNFAAIAGRKANGATGDTSGYMALYTNKSGVGFVERVRVSEDGDLRLLNNFMEWDELGADAAAPASNKARLYARDDGSGKTQLVVRFNTGAVQVLATEAA